MVSRCCKKEVVAIIEYYACINCGRPTDIILMQPDQKAKYDPDYYYDEVESS